MTFLLAQLQSTDPSIRLEHRLEFDNLPENWGAVLMLAIVVGACCWIVRTYRLEQRAGSTPAARMGLGALRCLVVLLLAAIWLEPVRTPYFHQHVESTTLVLADTSASMSIADRYLDAPQRAQLDGMLEWLGDKDQAGQPLARHELLRRLIGDPGGPVLSGLARRNRVRVLGFADQVTPLADLPARRSAEGEPPAIQDRPLDVPVNGLFTDLGSAVRRGVEELAGAPLAGVVVLGDGQINHGEPVEVLGDLVRALEAPIVALGLGDSSAPKNLRIVEWTGPSDAFVGDPLELSARLEAAGLAGEAVTLELYERPLDGAGERQLVETRSLVIPGDGTIEPQRFKRETARPGRMQYTLSAVPHADEPVDQDNTAQLSSNVIENKLRVLLVSGTPGYTYQFVSRVLQRDKTIEVSCWLQSADRTAVRDGDVVIDHLPSTAEELFEYDAVMLLDPDPQALPDDWPGLLDQHVTRNAAGLIFCAARQHTPALFHDPRCSALVALLPVVTDPDADLLLNQIGYYQKLSAPIEMTPAALAHPIFGGQSAGLSPEAWQQIARVFWHYPVKHEKSAATVLMRHGHPRMRNTHGGHVLMATQFVGSGRTAFIGFDGVWRWRRFGEELFNRFWVQLVRQMAEGRLTGGGGRGRIQTDGDSYRVGETVVLRARLTDSQYRPLEAEEVVAELQDPEGGSSQLILRAEPASRGNFSGQFSPDRAGEWIVRVALEGDEGQKVAISHALAVRQPDIEFRAAAMDPAPLRILCNRSAGGRYLNMSEASLIPELIADRHESKVRRGTPVPLWDKGWMLAALVGLLCVEWGLRKWMHLL